MDRKTLVSRTVVCTGFEREVLMQLRVCARVERRRWAGVKNVVGCCVLGDEVETAMLFCRVRARTADRQRGELGEGGQAG